MNVEEIRKEIHKYEKHGNNMQDIVELSALYNVCEHMTRKEHDADDISYVMNVEEEADDILPAYKNYKKVKMQYQLGEVNKEMVLKCFDYLGTEIKELMTAIYSGTDMPEEREKLNKLIHDLSVWNV